LRPLLPIYDCRRCRYAERREREAHTWLSEFVTLFIVINPLGTLPVFLAMTGGLDTATRRTTTSAAPRNDIEQRT
jgi:hypothetical protein